MKLKDVWIILLVILNLSSCTLFEDNKNILVKAPSTSTDTVPSISTGNVTNIDITYSIIKAQIISDGKNGIIEKGICWNTTNNPTINNSKLAIVSDSLTFTVKINGLQPNTTYYARAYATNKKGTGYGNVISFTTVDGVIDYDGNAYHIIKIGSQVWMAENLKVTHLNDGTNIDSLINKIYTDYEWNNLTTGALCWYSNNETNKSIYGGLYNWYAVNTGILAPPGWRIPSINDWIQLANTLGGESIAGGKMKETGISLWFNPTGATNSSGFSARPGGIRGTNYSGEFLALGTDANWWSSSAYNTSFVYNASINYAADSLKIDSLRTPKFDGLSVRCIKN